MSLVNDVLKFEIMLFLLKKCEKHSYIFTPQKEITVFCLYMSLVMRKPAFCICENKDADQLRGNREADQRLCFRYTDSTIFLLPKSGISSF